MMQGEVAPYKVAWLSGGKLHSSMHDTMPEAQRALADVPMPRMIMTLDDMATDGHYSWGIVPTFWGLLARYWWLVAIAGGTVLFLLTRNRLKSA